MGAMPLVLCPGLLCDAALWAPQIEALRGIAEVFIPDLAQADSMAAMGAAVLRQAPWPQFALAGLSMGGYAALEAFMQAPRRVTRLALLDARARPETEVDRARRAQLIALVERERGFSSLTRQLLPLMEDNVRRFPQLRLFSLPSLAPNGERRIELGVKGDPQTLDAAIAHLIAGVEAGGFRWEHDRGAGAGAP